MHRLTNTLRTLEDTHAVLQQSELLAGVINEQDCRDICTACCCIRSLRIRVEVRANVTEREVISRQLQLMHASVQHYRTEDLNTANTSYLSRTSFLVLRARRYPTKRSALWCEIHFCGNIRYFWLVSEESFWLCAYLDERDEVAQCASSALVGRAYSALENSIRSLWLKAVSAQTPWDWVTQF